MIAAGEGGEIAILPVRRALVAVADKSGVVELSRGLAERGAEIVSTGNTARVLEEAGISVTPVAEVTGFPEMLDGRVKTLHPRIHAGILADKRRPAHVDELGLQGIRPFDLVVANLYPFRETVAAGAAEPEVLERIDVGGPAMVRAAAKNFECVAVVVEPSQYGRVLREIDAHGGISRSTRRLLARRAFDHTADYDAAVAGWFADGAGDDSLPAAVRPLFVRIAELRYGENPHQRGAVYGVRGPDGRVAPPLGGAEVLQGKEMSFNNWLDAEAARAVVALFDRPCAAIVKHHNPCGVAVAGTPAEAYRRALEGDRVSAFGGIVAFNEEVDAEAAEAVAGIFTEVIVAPGYSTEALRAFERKAGLRVLRCPLPVPGGPEVRPIDGGALVQDPDSVREAREDMKVVTETEPTEEQWGDLVFAWKVASRVKSNAIVLARDLATVGVGAGQMNRVAAVEIAAWNAAGRAGGSCLASDAFFPFRDGVDRAAAAGVAAVVQPGGSVRDAEVIAAAEEHGMAMVLTSRRHFRH